MHDSKLIFVPFLLVKNNHKNLKISVDANYYLLKKEINKSMFISKTHDLP